MRKKVNDRKKEENDSDTIYELMTQNRMTHLFGKAQSKNGITEDDRTIIDVGDVKAYVYESMKPDENVQLTTLQHVNMMLYLDLYETASSEQNTKYPTVTLTLAQYKKIRNLKDDKTARKQMKDAANFFGRAQLDYHSEVEYDDSFYAVNIMDMIGYIKGKIYFKFGQTFSDSLAKTGSIMPYNRKILKNDIRRFPHAIGIYTKLISQKRNSLGKKNEDKIKIKNIIKDVTTLPTTDAVAGKGGRHYLVRIINPFFINLEQVINLLDGILEVTFIPPNKVRYTLENRPLQISYEEFLNTIVETKWNNYPVEKVKSIQAARNKHRKQNKKKRNPSQK